MRMVSVNSADMASLVPDAEELLNLPPEEQGKLILKLLLLHQCDHPIRKIAHSNFFDRGADGYSRYPLYRNRQHEVDAVLLDAWSWLETSHFLTRAPASNGNWFYVNKVGQQFAQSGVVAHRGNAFPPPEHQLHPTIREKTNSAFLDGDYDNAIFQAFKTIEIAVRKAGKLSKDLVGEPLMRAAFAAAENDKPAGPLTETHLPQGEQRSMAHLFAGAFGVFRNSTGHRNFRADSIEAIEILTIASYLMRVVDRLQAKPSEGTKS